MKLAAKRAVELRKPWVLDPVGCGATPYRTQARQAALDLRLRWGQREAAGRCAAAGLGMPTAAAAAALLRQGTGTRAQTAAAARPPPRQICAALLRLKPTVVRGNPSEILALAGAAHTTKGVDSTAAATGEGWAGAGDGGPGGIASANSRLCGRRGAPAGGSGSVPRLALLPFTPALLSAREPWRAGPRTAEALEAGKQIAREHGCIVAISGAEDLVRWRREAVWAWLGWSWAKGGSLDRAGLLQTCPSTAARSMHGSSTSLVGSAAAHLPFPPGFDLASHPALPRRPASGDRR